MICVIDDHIQQPLQSGVSQFIGVIVMAFFFFKVLQMSKCYTVEILILETLGVKVPLLAIILSHTYIQVYSKWMWCL